MNDWGVHIVRLDSSSPGGPLNALAEHPEVLLGLSSQSLSPAAPLPSLRCILFLEAPHWCQETADCCFSLSLSGFGAENACNTPGLKGAENSWYSLVILFQTGLPRTSTVHQAFQLSRDHLIQGHFNLGFIVPRTCVFFYFMEKYANFVGLYLLYISL